NVHAQTVHHSIDSERVRPRHMDQVGTVPGLDANGFVRSHAARSDQDICLASSIERMHQSVGSGLVDTDGVVARGATEEDGIKVSTTVEGVATQTTKHGVFTRTTQQQIITRTTFEEVVTV